MPYTKTPFLATISLALASGLALSSCGNDAATTQKASDAATESAKKAGSSATEKAKDAATDTTTKAKELASKVTLNKAGELTVCTSLPYKPFEFKEGKKVVGFDIDMMDAVAKALSAEVNVIDTQFESITSGAALNSKKCDIAAAGITINEKRAQAVAFSSPYFNATQALLVKKDATAASFEDLKGKKLAVQSGTTGQQYAKENAKDVQLVVFEDVAALTAAVKSGKVDAGINDDTVLREYVKTNADTKLAKEFDTGEKYGFAIQKDNNALLAVVNATIATAKTDGTYDASMQKWFGKKSS